MSCRVSPRRVVMVLLVVGASLPPAQGIAGARAVEQGDTQASGRATRGPQRGAAEPAPGRGSVARLDQLFDRYVLGQARGALGLDAPQMRAFAPRLQRLQVLRRRHARERQRLLAEITEMTRNGVSADEATLAARLDDLELRDRTAQAEIGDARRQVEETLTVEQRARFRVFEGRMERRKLELIAQARQQARPGRAVPPRSGSPGR